MKNITLNELATGQSGTVLSVHSSGAMRRRMIDLGIVEGTVIECVGKSPMKDPCAYLIRGAVIAIRAKDGRDVLLRTDDEGGAVCDGAY